MFTSPPGEGRQSRPSLRARLAGAGLAIALVAASALVTAPAASAAELPFSVTSPQNGSSVSSTTPTFSGTGTTGDTITLSYSGQQLGGYVAGTATVDEAGNWSTATSFGKANPGETETRVRVEARSADGADHGTFFITISFPQAPVPAAVFTLESPVDGETRNDFLNIVHFVGQGTPGNIVTVRYFNGRGGLSEAGTTTVGSDGRYDVFTNFSELPGDQKFANTFTSQTTPSGEPAAPRDLLATIYFVNAPVLANPLIITSPQNFATVETPTPAFTGTGEPGDTVTLTYGGQRLGTYTAGTALIDADGNWEVPVTDFSDANFGETNINVQANSVSPTGTTRPSTGVNLVFAEAPVEVTEFTLTSPVEGETRDDLLNIVHFIGTGEPGNTVYVQYFNASGTLSQAGDPTIVRPDGTFDVFATFPELPADQKFVNTFTQQADPAGNLVAREILRNFFFTQAPVESRPFIVTSPQQNEAVDSITPEFTGTGNPGDTVQLSYSGQSNLTYSAGTAVIDANGDWIVPATDFSNANFGETDIRVVALAVGPLGEDRTGDRNVDIVLPFAPVDRIDFTVTTPEEGDTIADPRPGVPYIGTGEPGNTIVVQYFPDGGGLSEAGRGIVNEDGNFEVLAVFDDLGATTFSANTFTQQLDSDGEKVAREIARTIFFEIAPGAPQLDAPTLNEPIVDGLEVTFSGTGRAGATVEVDVVAAGLAQQNQRALVAPTTLSALVAPDGTWNVSGEFEPGDYAASATQFTGDGTDRSAPTDTETFTITAGVVTPPTDQPGDGATPGGSGSNPVNTGALPSTGNRGATGGLAATGADASGALMLGLLSIAAGAAVLIARRARIGAQR